MNKILTEVSADTVQRPQPQGGFVRIDGQDFYQIDNCDEMPPFLMSIVSAGDHWMYVSSFGGLTAGRVSAEHCLFPYQTVDRLHDCHPHTGPVTLIRHQGQSGDTELWQPFQNGAGGASVGSRRLLKHVAGDQVVFEETHDQLGLVFRYRWRTSRRFGFVRTATLENRGGEEIDVEIVDGLQNLCPSGVSLFTYQQASCFSGRLQAE